LPLSLITLLSLIILSSLITSPSLIILLSLIASPSSLITLLSPIVLPPSLLARSGNWISRVQLLGVAGLILTYYILKILKKKVVSY